MAWALLSFQIPVALGTQGAQDLEVIFHNSSPLSPVLSVTRVLGPHAAQSGCRSPLVTYPLLTPLVKWNLLFAPMHHAYPAPRVLVTCYPLSTVLL